ncbi:WHG domain-containing protein [Bradyrhizobium sp. AUGA SZCCT0051]|nr:WHG domain-containing protein [Bradyrhizobium sp. AUGA SZCCT0124]MBR1310983.1 WHG domain-containing protein [Bradyrhizobium sp. AUGA SZCCT0051]MBR1339397.1 WHG domain-containing protein [Bradyrhizobium sp. AUGA SZCCT0105]MBR1353971.1 WHG domain-containing protein [Bradyrhizobium sp. AUGA SZCCT0045]
MALIKEILAATPGREAEDAERLSLLLWAATHGVISLQINKPTLRWPRATALVEELMRAMIRPGAAAS